LKPCLFVSLDDVELAALGEVAEEAVADAELALPARHRVRAEAWSTSVKTNVTAPEGSSRDIGFMMPGCGAGVFKSGSDGARTRDLRRDRRRSTPFTLSRRIEGDARQRFGASRGSRLLTANT